MAFFGRKERIERQELWCHDCSNYVQFDIDVSMDGNHVLNCPNCDHEHCRVVEKGVITDIRWDTRNGVPSYQVQPQFVTTSTVSTYTTTSSSDVFLYELWSNSSSTTGTT